MLILGLETSCDETSAAVVRNGREVLSCVISSSKNDFNSLGGVIPEDAARKQLESILPVIELSLKQAEVSHEELDAIAVTHGPGLLGSLLVGTSTARVLGKIWNKPLLAVHHTLGHLSSTWLNAPSSPDPFSLREKREPEQKEQFEEKTAMNPHILTFARSMRKEPTPAEKLLWESLKNRKLGAKFRRQHPIQSRILDFYCDEFRLGIELDGSIHESSEQSFYDNARTEVLKELGIQIIRYRNEEVEKDIQSVLRRISEHLHSPLPSGEGQGVRVKEIEEPAFPVLTLSVSGGHTDLWYRTSHMTGTLAGSTRDDAAGEAYDKGAVLLGLPYPGGPALAALAKKGDETAFAFPHPLKSDKVPDFSFSGLKTSLKYLLRDMGPKAEDARTRADIAASFQNAINAHLLSRIEMALELYPETKELHIVGGVSANMHLRARVTACGARAGVTVRWPEKLTYCTDNAAMIASAAFFASREKNEPQGPFGTHATFSLQALLEPVR